MLNLLKLIGWAKRQPEAKRVAQILSKHVMNNLFNLRQCNTRCEYILHDCINHIFSKSLTNFWDSATIYTCRCVGRTLCSIRSLIVFRQQVQRRFYQVSTYRTRGYQYLTRVVLTPIDLVSSHDPVAWRNVCSGSSCFQLIFGCKSLTVEKSNFKWNKE